jgi:hypothetical protein
MTGRGERHKQCKELVCCAALRRAMLTGQNAEAVGLLELSNSGDTTN